MEFSGPWLRRHFHRPQHTPTFTSRETDFSTRSIFAAGKFRFSTRIPRIAQFKNTPAMAEAV